MEVGILMEIDIPKIVLSGAEKLGVSLSYDAAGLFDLYYKILSEHAARFNLTTITDPQGASRTHFLDSLALLTVADFQGADVIDVGSGAGFPGVPIKIAMPSARLTLLDATRKRVDFLSHLCAMLGIEARCIHARAEEILHDENFREQFDIAVSRAVASLNVLCELCLPFVRVGGVFLAMKGVESEKEISDAHTAIETLGGKFEKKIDYEIPAADVPPTDFAETGSESITHSIVIIRKTKETPDKYPRRFAKMTKSPL